MNGLTAASLKGGATSSSWYGIYHKLWSQKFPNLKIKEVQVADDNAEVTKTVLGVNSGNPPDLMGVGASAGELPVLVKRGALENLDKYYAAAGIKPTDFLKPVADYLRYDGHWYGLPGASNPTLGTILYIPEKVKEAGLDPAHMPVTWDALWEATKKVTRFGPDGQLQRIGLPVEIPGVVEADLRWIDLYCGGQTTYDPAANKYHANLPCEKAYFNYNKRLLDFYGGMAKYTKFISGDPSIWGCSPKAYIPSGKLLFDPDAYWSGAQMDTCYNVNWALGPPPTQHNTPSEWSALRPDAWFLAIPKGAKNPQLAFDFVKFTIWDHGDLLGPTTNGYVRAGQATAWADGLIQHEADVRKKNGYPGNPMVQAMPVVIRGAELGTSIYPKNPNAQYFNEQMALAWENVAYGRQDVSTALDNVQRLMDAKQ